MTYDIFDVGFDLIRLAVRREDIEPFLHEHAAERLLIEEKGIDRGEVGNQWWFQPFTAVPEFFEVR